MASDDDNHDAVIMNLRERVERLERREAELTELFRLLNKLHDASTARFNAIDKTTELLADMLCRHLGLPPVSDHAA